MTPAFNASPSFCTCCVSQASSVQAYRDLSEARVDASSRAASKFCSEENGPVLLLTLGASVASACRPGAFDPHANSLRRHLCFQWLRGWRLACAQGPGDILLASVAISNLNWAHSAVCRRRATTRRSSTPHLHKKKWARHTVLHACLFPQAGKRRRTRKTFRQPVQRGCR